MTMSIVRDLRRELIELGTRTKKTMGKTISVWNWSWSRPVFLVNREVCEGSLALT